MSAATLRRRRMKARLPRPLLKDPACVAYWSAAVYDAVNDRLPDLRGNGLHARLGSAVGADTNDPTRLVYAGEKYAYCPGVSGNVPSTPDSPALSITGAIDIRWRATGDASPPAALETLAAKWTSTGNNRSWRVARLTDNKLRLTLSADGSALVNSDSSVAPTNGDWVQVTWRPSDGRVQWFTAPGSLVSPAAGDFTQLGTDGTAAVASIFDSTAPLNFGGRDGGTADLWAGKLYRLQLRDGIDGALVADFNAASLAEPFDTVAGGAGETWTLNRSAAGKKLTVVDRTLLLLGSDDYLEIADNPLLNFGAGQDYAVALAFRITPAPGSNTAPFSKYDGGIGPGWGLDFRSTGIARAFLRDGSSNFSDDGPAISAGVATVAVARRSGATAETFVNGVSGGATATTAASLANSTAVRIGRRPDGVQTDLAVVGGAVFRRGPTDAEIARLRAELLRV